MATPSRSMPDGRHPPPSPEVSNVSDPSKASTPGRLGDPLFGAVCARSLQLLADRLGQPRTPETPHNQTPNRKSPDATDIRANSKEQQS